MDDAINVTKKYDLQLFCGEWGVYEPVDRELAYTWTRDMISVFNERGCVKMRFGRVITLLPLQGVLMLSSVTQGVALG